MAANARAQAHPEGVWQQTPKRTVAETEKWRCRCMPKRETAEKVWQQTPEREITEEVRWHQTQECEPTEEVGWQQTPEHKPAEEVCGSKRQSASPLRKCEVGAVAGNRMMRPMPMLWHATLRCRWRWRQ